MTAFEVKTLDFQLKGLCAVFCDENLFCNAFDICFSGGTSIWRLRYGNTDAKCSITLGSVHYLFEGRGA